MTDKPITLPTLPAYFFNGCRITTEEFQTYARAAVLADRALNATTQGMVLVPREPTQEMLPEAWRIANGKPGLGVDHECLRAIYRAMLAAAPVAPVPSHSPDNPPRLRRDGETLADYRTAMGWPATPTPTPEPPAGWREIISEARRGLDDATPSAYDNSGYRDYAGTVLDAIEDELSALDAAPTAPIPAVDAVAGELVASAPGAARGLAQSLAAIAEKCRVGYMMSKGTHRIIRDAVAISEALAAALAPRAGSETAASASVQGVMGAEVVTNEMVNRFLGWKLPPDFSPDGGITFKRVYNETSPFGPRIAEPTGTNLFTADQARAMLEYVIGATPAAPSQGAGTGEKR
jgi:hypothetical protein